MGGQQCGGAALPLVLGQMQDGPERRGHVRMDEDLEAWFQLLRHHDSPSCIDHHSFAAIAFDQFDCLFDIDNLGTHAPIQLCNHSNRLFALFAYRRLMCHSLP